MKRLGTSIRSLLNRIKTSDQAFLIVIPIAIGLLGGFGAALLRVLIHFFEKQFWGTWGDPYGWLRTLLVPAAGAFVVGVIIYFFSREAKGHGVPEVMEAISLKNGIIRPRVVIGKVIASAITIASGGSVGREGPIVQIGSAIGSTVGQIFKLSRRRMQTLVGCGAAAGIAAAFNAPIAGAMFSVEIILGDFAVSQFAPIVISSVSATVVSRLFYGNYPAFMVPKYELVHPLELIPYALLGLICGLVAIFYVKVLYLFEDKFDTLKKPDYVKTTIGGLLIGLLGISFPQVFGVGYEAMDQALYGKTELWLLFALIFIKILATSITLGSGSSGGIFAPSLFIGAMTGGFFGNILHRLFPAVTAGSGAYALVAMSAVVAAATHAPITAILIIFEMTNDYKIILPLMIATTISSLLATWLQDGSIYTLKLMRRGINLQKGKEINVLKAMKVKDVMRDTIEIISPRTSLKEIIEKFISSKHSYFYITDEKDRISEKISQAEISAIAPDYEHLKDFVMAHDIASPNPLVVHEDDNLDYVMREFGRENISEIPVISSSDPEKILGTIWRIDVISAYNKEILRRDLAGEVSTLMASANGINPVEVTDGLYILEIDVPTAFVGKKIKEIDVRNQYGVDIVLIRQRWADKKMRTRNPNADYIFQADDNLLILGEKKKVEFMSKI
jgi:CIC family chloride channel protein